MQLIHLFAKDYIASRWSGGTTTQIAIAPKDAVYANRDFLWRISSASVDLDESIFTPLPDYQRWIAPINGNMRLSHDNGAYVELTPYSVYQFDGALPTHSQGRCTDFNLMLRKGKTYGQMRSVALTAGSVQNIAVQSSSEKPFSQADLLIYCCKGAADVISDESSIRLIPSESALAANANGVLKVSAAKDCILMLAEILSL